MIELPLFNIVSLSIIGVLEILLGLYVLSTYEKSGAIIAFGLLSLCIGLWVLSNGPTLLLERGSLTLDLVTRSAWIFALLTFHFILLFVFLYPYPTYEINTRFLIFLFIPAAILSLLIYFSKSLVVGFDSTSQANTVFGPDYWLVLLYFVFIFIFSLIEGMRKIKRLDGIHRSVMGLFLAGIFLSGVIGLTSHLILPYVFKIEPPLWIGPGASAIWLGLMGWILVKK